jgi:hypothetical protein
MYQIQPYSFTQAKKHNVIIKPSTRKGKKVDVFDKNQKFITSIGQIGYKDYPSYLKVDRNLAEEKKRLYKIRHNKDRNVPMTAGFFADKILW